MARRRQNRERGPRVNPLHIAAAAAVVFLLIVGALAVNDELRMRRVRQEVAAVREELGPGELEGELRAAVVAVTQSRLRREGFAGKIDRPAVTPAGADGRRWRVDGWIRDRDRGEPRPVSAAWLVIYSAGKRRWQVEELAVGGESLLGP